MGTRRSSSSLAALFSLVGLIALTAPGAAVRAETYTVDPVHSSLLFRIKHLSVSYVYGRFNNPEGTINVDDADPTKSSFDISVKVANIDTGNKNRDNHLKTPEFFNASEFPTMTFKSTSVKVGDDKKLEVTGNLTIHGQTKPVTATLEHVGTGNTPMGQRAGYDGSLTIKRSDFGMNQMLEAIGDDVTIKIGLEALKK
jgi:polyisoprenoid-binding protein YceI